jgi:hypothetical protein
MTISTITRSRTFLPLLCVLFSTSVLARHYSRRTAFLPRKNLSTVSSSLSRSSPRFSELDASTFSSERDAQILTEYASSLVIAAQLCRGGSQYYEEDNYYDDRGYGGNKEDYYSNQYGNDSNYNYEDNSFDDRGPSVCTSRSETEIKFVTPSKSFRAIYSRVRLDSLIIRWFLNLTFCYFPSNFDATVPHLIAS